MINKFFYKSFLYPILFLLLIFSIQDVSAVGIAGEKLIRFIDFKPGLEQTFTYFASTGNADKIMDYEVHAKGELKDFITLSPSLIKDVIPGEMPAFTARMKLPSEMESGEHEAFICVLETKTKGPGTAMIGVRTEACAVVRVMVLYEGKYVEMRFKGQDVNIGEKARFAVTVKSWSKVDIDSVKAFIDIYSFEDNFQNKITTIETEEKLLKSNAEIDLTALLDTTGFKVGEYKAVATLFYDGENKTQALSFRIGTLRVEILNYTREFEKGKVNKFDIIVENNWNKKIEGVYADVFIDEETLRTPTISIKQWERTTLTTFWDTTEKELGEYNGKIIVYYKDKTTEKSVKVEVIRGKEEIRRMWLTGIATAVIVILILSLIILFLKSQQRAKAEKGKSIKKKIKARKNRKKARIKEAKQG